MTDHETDELLDDIAVLGTGTIHRDDESSGLRIQVRPSWIDRRWYWRLGDMPGREGTVESVSGRMQIHCWLDGEAATWREAIAAGMALIETLTAGVPMDDDPVIGDLEVIETLDDLESMNPVVYHNDHATGVRIEIKRDGFDPPKWYWLLDDMPGRTGAVEALTTRLTGMIYLNGFASTVREAKAEGLALIGRIATGTTTKQDGMHP